MQTYRCQRCGQVLASFITITPQMPLPFSHTAAMAQLQIRQREHQDRCSGAPVKGYLKRLRLPRIDLGRRELSMKELSMNKLSMKKKELP